MVWRIAVAEIYRSVTRARYWLLLLLTLGYGTLASGAEAEAVARGAGVASGWQLAVSVGMQVLWVLVLALPLVVGGNVAHDRATGHIRLQRVRGASSATVALGRLGAAAALSLLGVSVVILAMLLASVIATPRGSSVGLAVGFEPRILDALPIVWLTLVGTIHILAATVLLAGATLTGWLLAKPRAAEFAPTLLVLGLGFVMTGGLSSLNPLERISFLQLHGISWTAPGAMLGYWSCCLLALGVSVVRVAQQRNGV